MKPTLQEIADLYISGKSLSEVGKVCGLPIQTVSNRLKKHGTPTRQFQKIFKADEDIIISQFLSGKSNSEIAKKLGVGGGTTAKIIRKHGYDIVLAGYAKRKLTLKTDYFKVIDSSEKAYFLGLLYADGCVSTGKQTIAISLLEKDKYILQKLSLILYGEDRVKNVKVKQQSHQQLCVFNIYSKEMCYDLINLGCVERKSFLGCAFPKLPDPLNKHFIRGVFDGDGTVTHGGQSTHHLIFLGDKLFLEDLSSTLLEDIGITTYTFFPRNKAKNPASILYSLAYSNRHSLIALYTYFYKEVDLFSSRKKERFKSTLNSYSKDKAFVEEVKSINF